MKKMKVSAAENQGFDSACLTDLSKTELNEIEGGGWIADAVSYFVQHYKCSCSPSPLDVPEFSYGLI